MIKPFRWVKWLIKSIFGVKEMITLPTGLNEFMKGQNLDGLKPFALLYRNKWDSVNNKYALEDTPIDISALIAKPNTLSMTLDVNEVAQYNANNVTLTISDTKNYFVEGTPNSYFPEGYQIYGSRIILYYGTDGVNRTPLFTGVIKDLPTHKPENYQVDVKLVSPLEMLKDIEAKDFSDKFTVEELIYKSTDSDGHRIYWTTGTGVGGLDAVYADGTKLFEGVDYETDQLNALGLPAIVTIINSNLYSATITADYYTWKTGLTVEQIVAGLVGLAGYDSGSEDIRNVVWNVAIRGREDTKVLAAVGYTKNGLNYNSKDNFNGQVFNTADYRYLRHNYFPENFKLSIDILVSNPHGDNTAQTARTYFFGETTAQNGAYNGVAIVVEGPVPQLLRVFCYKMVNGNATGYTLITSKSPSSLYNQRTSLTITRSGTDVSISGESGTANYTFASSFDFGNSNEWNEYVIPYRAYMGFESYRMELLNDSNSVILNKGILLENIANTPSVWSQLSGTVENENAQYVSKYRVQQGGTLSAWKNYQFNAYLGIETDKIQFLINITSGTTDIFNVELEYLSTSISLGLVNLSGLTVLEALQDFALISGYEFGVDRQGVFFFRPRVSSTTPTYILDHDEIVKVDTVKKNLSDFFTKLTLTFAQVPLEFYANTGERPTLADKYGIINKEIDKPDIVNYDNPELAQAIGPQLLEVYSALPNMIQVTGKLNLALELADIVSLRRNFNLVEPNSETDYAKFITQQTYYRACKITGMNYNFAKRQITYTLRDVSNSNNFPPVDAYGFPYDLPIQLGKLKKE